MCYRVHIQESQYRELRGGSNSLTDLRPGEGGIPMNHADLKGGMSLPVPCKTSQKCWCEKYMSGRDRIKGGDLDE